MSTVLKLWALATALLVVAAMIWSFVPVLVPILGITIGIGGLVAVVVTLARQLERRRGVRPDN